MIYGILGISRTSRHCCVKIEHKGYEVSIALDDSCGSFTKLLRCDIRVFKDTKNVTAELFPGQENNLRTADDLLMVLQAIDKLEA